MEEDWFSLQWIHGYRAAQKNFRIYPGAGRSKATNKQSEDSCYSCVHTTVNECAHRLRQNLDVCVCEWVAVALALSYTLYTTKWKKANLQIQIERAL